MVYFDPERVYDSIKRLIQLKEEPQTKETPEWGDERAGRYNLILSRIPILSPDDLVEYTKYIADEIKQDYDAIIKEVENSTSELTRENESRLETALADSLRKGAEGIRRKVIDHILSRLRPLCSDDVYTTIEREVY